MSASVVDVVRIGSETWAWSSCSFTVDGFPTEGVVALDFEEKLEVRTVYSNRQDIAPLGQSAGRYQVAAFPLRMLRDSARALKAYLDATAKAKGLGSYGQATFTLGLQLTGRDVGDSLPSTTYFASCRIVSEKPDQEEGTRALVTEFSVACLGIVKDGISLWNALPDIVGGFPAVDTITIGGLQAPGKWTLDSANKVYGWDIRQGYALSGATVVPKGDSLVEPEFVVEIWDPVDLIAFRLFRKLYLKKALVATPGALVAMALGIDHPELKELGCVSVVVREVSFLKNDGFGVYMCKVKFLQYRRPLPALSKPNAAIPAVTQAKPTAVTAADRELQAAQARLAAANHP